MFIEILRSDLFNKGTIAAAPDFNMLVQMFPQNVNSNVRLILMMFRHLRLIGIMVRVLILLLLVRFILLRR